MAQESKDVDEVIEDAFGRIAADRNFATPQRIAALHLVRRRESRESSRSLRLGEVMIREGLLTKAQALEILKEAHKSVGDHARIGGYELLKKLGEGAMGAVYQAKQLSMNRIVALKLLPRSLSSEEGARERFLREARLVARLNHPNIVRGYEVGEGNGYHFFAMEFVDGGNMLQYLRRNGPVEENEAIDIGVQIGRALDHAHEKGVIHRDVKPDNIMIGLAGVYKLADLGLAVRQDDAEHLTQTGNTVGTPYYMAPEQAQGRADLDGRCDIYALAASLYHLATGRPPFEGANVATILSRRLMEDPPAPCSVHVGITRAFSAVILKAMARKPEDRYQTCAEFIADLERIADDEEPSCIELAAEAPLATENAQGQAVPAVQAGPSVLSRILRPFTVSRLVVAAATIALVTAIIWAARNHEALRGPRHPYEPDAKWTASPTQLTENRGAEVRQAWLELRAKLHENAGNADARIALLRDFMAKHPDTAYGKYARDLLNEYESHE